MKALAVFFDQLEQRTAERSGLGGKRVKNFQPSGHLAELDGSLLINGRYATEVVAFLRKRGAKIPIPGISARMNGEDLNEWALDSDVEGFESGGDPEKLEFEGEASS